MKKEKNFFPSSYFAFVKGSREGCMAMPALLHEHKYYGKDYEKKTNRMIPMKMFAVKHKSDDDSEDNQRDNFLNHL